MIYLHDKILPEQTPSTAAELDDQQLRVTTREYREHRAHYAAIAAYLLNLGERFVPEAREFAAEFARLTLAVDILNTEERARHSVPDLIVSLQAVAAIHAERMHP